MKLTDLLKQEHDLVERGLDVLRAVAERSADAPVPSEAAEDLVDFFDAFADEAHHAKEEQSLFPALRAHGVPVERGPIAVMLSEHDDGRRLIAELRQALDLGLDSRQGGELFRETARDYAILLGQHIFKENHVLFEMADRVLPDELNESLGAQYGAEHHAALARHADVILRLARQFLSPTAASGGAQP